MEKVKSRAGLVGRLRHNVRERITPNIDTDRISQNLTEGGSVANVMARYSEMLPANVRKNAVHAIELMMTASPGFKGDWNAYLKACDKWAAGLFGKENVLSIAHHLDETTPHTQIVVMPLKDGKLNAKHFIGGSRDRMRELQDDFHRTVGVPAGLDRGQPRAETKARHRHHSLVVKALDDRSAKLDEREAKIKEAAAEFKSIMGTTPTEVRKLKGQWDHQTPDSLRQFASLIERKGFRTVGEYRQAQEAQREKEQQIQRGHSLSR